MHLLKKRVKYEQIFKNYFMKLGASGVETVGGPVETFGPRG